MDDFNTDGFKSVKAEKTYWVYTAAGVARSKEKNAQTQRREGQPIERADPRYCSALWIENGWVREADQ